MKRGNRKCEKIRKRRCHKVFRTLSPSDQLQLGDMQKRMIELDSGKFVKSSELKAATVSMKEEVAVATRKMQVR